MPYDGGVFYCAAPDIFYAKDQDGDGVADVKKLMFKGFGTQNVQGLLNGLLWGPDGWIYGVSGGNGGDIQNLTRPDAKLVSVRGRDFRFKPDGSAFEAISGGGQFGHSFDDWGHRFTCNNSNHIRQIMLPADYIDRNPAMAAPAVLDDIAEEGAAAPVYRISPAEPWRVVRTRQRAEDPESRKRLPPTELVATGFFTSATGLTIYRGDAFLAEYRGNAFIGDVGGNLVHRKSLRKQGAKYLATRADAGTEFLASTDNWFRPVNFTDTPDGTLLILDMYRETIEHPFSLPEPIKKHLDLTSGKDLGRIYKLVPESGYRPRSPKLSDAPTRDLVPFLADPAAWWRETAQRLLIEHQDKSVAPALRQLAKARPNPLGRLHALWTLDALDQLDNETLILAFDDPEAGVREQAVKLCDGRALTQLENAPLVSRLLATAEDPDPMVRFQTAFTLGFLTKRNANAIAALSKIADRDASDAWTRAAVLSSIVDRADDLMLSLAEVPGFLKRPEGRAWLDDLSVVLGNQNNAASIKKVVKRFTGPGSDPLLTSPVLLGLGVGIERAGGSLRELLKNIPSSILSKVFENAEKVSLRDGAESSRVDAISLLGLGPVERVFLLTPTLLDARQPTSVQLAAIQTLGRQSDPRVAETIIERWKSLSPSVRREALEALFARSERISELLHALQTKRISASEIDPARRKQLVENGDPKIRSFALKVLGSPSSSNRKDVILAYREALSLKGDVERGRVLFRKLCASCHKAEEEGLEIGPNLATVAGRSGEDLLTHILDPNREVAPGFVYYSLETTDGRVVTGMIASESAIAVTLKRAQGLTDVVPRARIASIASSGLSLMPEGLEKGLDPRDLADLIALIQKIKSTGPASSGR